MIKNSDIYENIQNEIKILENYNFFKALLQDDIRNIYAINGCNSYFALKKRLEESCNHHIPVILGSYSKTNILNTNSMKMVPLKYKRCIFCGKIMTYDLNEDLAIDASNYKDDYNENYNNLDIKFMNILNELLYFSKEFSEYDILIKEFKNIIENNNQYVKSKKKN